MPKRIYSADEYLKGLEAQGIVVHDAMRSTVKRLNGQGILEGYPAIDDAANPLLPPGDARYEAGHFEKVKDAQEKIEAFRIAHEEEDRENARIIERREALDKAVKERWAAEEEEEARRKEKRKTAADAMADGYARQLAQREPVVHVEQSGFVWAEPQNASSFSPTAIMVTLRRAELFALIQHLAASGHSAQRVAELAALLV